MYILIYYYYELLLLVDVPGLISHVPTQCLFNTKIGMMQTFSTFTENGRGSATPLRLTEYV